MDYNKRILFAVVVTTLMWSCSGEDEPDPILDTPAATYYIQANPAVTHQEMIGFGAAMTWWSDRVISSPHTEEIYDLIFNDLEIDLLRLKNWYYPADYPANKSPQQMVSNGDLTMFHATNEFYAKAKEMNPNIKVLLTSWGPPASLKSNNHLREGTLKKEGTRYMYEEYAQYWEDALDHIPFSPDLLSIQNEPGYTNPGWTTCAWAPVETLSLAGYSEGLAAVWAKIKDRPEVPKLVGPDTENQNAFNSFTPVIYDREEISYLGWHPYNFNEQTPLNQTHQWFGEINSRFGSKPNIMTEYSNMSWLKTARLIHRSLTLANTSAYVYWELVWGDQNRRDFPMINIDASGNYSTTGFYHLMKHFSKFIHLGHKRIDVNSDNSSLEVSAFLNPAGNQVTYVIINPDNRESDYQVRVQDRNVIGLTAYQSTVGNYFKKIEALTPDKSVKILRNSVTTIVADL